MRKIHKGRGFLILVEEDLQRLLVFMHGKMQEGVDASTPRRELRTASTPERREDDKARVRWSFPQDAWEIHYTDEDGKRHRSVKGFSVPRKDLSGRMFSKSEYQELRNSALDRARKAWNQLDKTTETRYVIPA